MIASTICQENKVAGKLVRTATELIKDISTTFSVRTLLEYETVRNYVPSRSYTNFVKLCELGP